nr:hypothetical protein [Tanacetum cinerariifolium]
MKELEVEEARGRGKVYKWETATYGRIWIDDDIHDHRSSDSEFPAIVFNDTLMPEVALSGMTKEMGMDIDARLSMRHIDAKGLVVFTSHAWRRLFDIRGPLVKLMLEFFNTYRFDNLVLDLDTNGFLSFQLGGARNERLLGGDLAIYGVLEYCPFYLLITNALRRLCHRLIAHTIAGRGQAPEKVTSTDIYFLRSMDQDAVNLPYLLAHYLFRHVKRRNQGAQMSRGYFIARLADHFGLLMEESLQKTTIVVRELGEIDLAELARLHICASLGDV